MDIVSGIFWKKIENGEALRSCATVGYALGENKYRYSIEDTKIDSPYNTYQHTGLMPTPITNPGLESIIAAVNPTNTSYLYFLSDRRGNMYYATNFEQHIENRKKVGLTI
jgi:UPF0755 protein